MNTERLKEIEKPKYKRHVTASRAVTQAREFLMAHGFTVSRANDVSANGPDLVAIKDGFGCKVEVKSVSNDRGTWKVRKVFRTEDDFVLLVFPSGAVHVEPMKTHLSRCSKDGTRFVTEIGRIYE